MPRECAFCDEELSAVDVVSELYCCDNCYNNRGAEGACHRDCEYNICRIWMNNTRAIDNHEDALGW